MATTVTSKGQVTIPKPIRERLGIEPGSSVDFQMDASGNVILLKADRSRPRNRFDAVRGILAPNPSTDEIMALLRGDD